MSTFAGRALDGAVRVASALHLRWLLRETVRRLPPSLRVRLNKAQVRMGYMQGLTKVPEDAVIGSYRAALELMGPELDEPGAAYLEFGVYVGTTLSCMYHAAAGRSAPVPRLVGFDSFQGMPEGVEEQDDHRWRAGDLYSDLELTEANLVKLGVPLESVELVPGWFEDTLTDETRKRLGIERAPIVMVDCVIASATATALSFLTPLIRDRSLIYFDDWAAADIHDQGLGERAAFEDWLAQHPEFSAEELPALQYWSDVRAFMVSRRAT
jgi:O-methyltransferase